METNRYFLELAYKGTSYHGWQLQKNAHSVQEELENALFILLGEKTSITGSGRTDAGVHASQQFAHFDSKILIGEEAFLKKLNGILPKDIAAYSIKRVKFDAHTRFDAIWRSYVYRICLRKDPFELDAAWIMFNSPNIALMNQAASLLLSHEDFQCFSKVHTDVNNFNCKIKTAYWEQNGSLLLFHITANRFLRGMVRAIVGTLVEVGTGKIGIEDFQSILDSRNRKAAKASAPAKGLYLCRITYPENLYL
ncbi:tRNA pseudouridine(38-40) synthase TruA [Cecembia sp.]|uniref:tRNA pseudouridine(38-40) synthase TruA n=1 Tax=Cecembia sp. TaxID=1898110 RepID=UPI0025BB1989|nr:tRNA pseudouridine(38-40) synthase TruA [Cecembia sp.]